LERQAGLLYERVVGQLVAPFDETAERLVDDRGES
jgi:hypothetical protein